MMLLLLGCGGQVPVVQGPFYPGEPTITDLTWGCVVEDAEWTFVILTAQWTGGGRIYITDDLTVVEEHRVRSVGAQADGSADELELTLDVVADWQDASAGSATRWRCDDLDRLSFLATVLSTDGSQRTDCRSWGADPGIWEGSKDIEGCQTVLEGADTGEGE